MATLQEYEAWLLEERKKSAEKQAAKKKRAAPKSAPKSAPKKKKLPDYGVELKPEDRWMLKGPKLK